MGPCGPSLTCGPTADPSSGPSVRLKQVAADGDDRYADRKGPVRGGLVLEGATIQPRPACVRVGREGTA
jgi:hypothetical protein